jgi:hypothetical protein
MPRIASPLPTNLGPDVRSGRTRGAPSATAWVRPLRTCEGLRSIHLTRSHRLGWSVTRIATCCMVRSAGGRPGRNWGVGSGTLEGGWRPWPVTASPCSSSEVWCTCCCRSTYPTSSCHRWRWSPTWPFSDESPTHGRTPSGSSSTPCDGRQERTFPVWQGRLVDRSSALSPTCCRHRQQRRRTCTEQPPRGATGSPCSSIAEVTSFTFVQPRGMASNA